MADLKINVQSNIPFYSYSVPHVTSCLLQASSENLMFQNYYNEQERKSDEEFINMFVNKRSNKVKKKVQLCQKVCEAKKHLIEIINLKEQLEIDRQDLDCCSIEFDVKWQEVVNKQNQINDLLLKFDSESVSSLKKAVKRRIKKRLSKQKKNLKQRLLKNNSDTVAKEKHYLIDKFLSTKSIEVESVKRKESFKRQADAVLHEVRRKKYEAKKMLSLLEALLKLRQLRSHQEIVHGGYCSQQITETFNHLISHFQGLWKDQCEIYNLEEKGLKVMLDESEMPFPKIPTFQKILKQWEHVIFGIQPETENYSYLTQADYNVDLLVFIRGEWDQYVSNSSGVLSSSIPVGWVLPSETENEEWKSYVKRKKKL